MLYMHFPKVKASLILINFLTNKDIAHIRVIKVLKLHSNIYKYIIYYKDFFKKKNYKQILEILTNL